METTISNFHTSFYIPEIQNLASHIPHVEIMGKNHYGNSHPTMFKCYESFQDVLCLRGYSETEIATFTHQIQS